MKNDWKITISYADVAQATQGTYGNCMLARAIERTIAEALYVSVKGSEISFSVKETRTRYTFATPKSAHRLLKEYDKVGVDGAINFVGQSFWLHLDEAEQTPMAAPRNTQEARVYQENYRRRQAALTPERKEQMRQARIKRTANARRK